ncbi:MAG: hypothetical protein ABI591_20510 [Kofleriaceae bacterium]
MNRILGIAIAAVTIVGGPKAASAARLAYEIHPGDLACPSPARFAEEVSAKLGFSPWTGDGLTVRVSINLSTGRYTGQLVQDRDHMREFNADTCRRVADLLVTATAIALDRSEPVKPANPDPSGGGGLYGARVRVATADSPPPRADEVVLPANPATEWAFAPRNNNFQLGLGMDSIAGGFMVSGAVPVFGGHLDLGVGHRSSSYANASSSLTFVDALYMWPVFYLNKNSSFEVPIFAGGGLAAFWTSQNGGGTASMTTSDSKVLPELAIGQGLQFRKLPVEFLFAMTLALGDPPDGGSNFGIDVAFRYVFRGR